MENDRITADHLSALIPERGWRGIHDRVAALIDGGDLAPGARLPTVRDLADVLAVAPSTVAEAWTVLRRGGYLQTRRRGGTVVAGSAGASGPGAEPGGWASIDLLHARPDPAFLPDPAAALIASLQPDRRLFGAETITTSLRAAAAARWPFDATDFTALPPGFPSLRLVLTALSARVVAVEEPSYLRVVALRDETDVTVIPVGSDARGPRPDSLAAALDRGADAVVLQPHHAIPDGRSLTRGRRDEVAEVLRERAQTPWLIEERPHAGLAEHWSEPVSLGQLLPERTVQLAHFWRAFGADLPVSVAGGAREPLTRIAERQRRTGVRVAPLIQTALARLLDDAGAQSRTRAAAVAYARRRAALAKALTARGLRDEAHGGLFAWLPVADEQRAVDELAAGGIAVTAGGDSWISPAPPRHLRVSATRLPDDAGRIGELAAAIEIAVSGGSPVDRE